MTGTADTEAEEFAKIYKLDVMVIPTNRDLKRVEEPDTVYRTEREKYEAIVSDILEKQKQGRPVLVGTVSIEKSERLSKLLKQRGIKHVVLNAKYHAQEAEIVAQAGPQGHRHDRDEHGGPRHRHPARRQSRVHGAPADARRRNRRTAPEGRGEVRRRRRVRLLLSTSTTSIACRARAYERIFRRSSSQTDAEHDEVVALGGLHIIATERHEARRIDNQLRGRAGRQGDPGSSRFYLSLEDDLMRIFGSDRISGLMQRLGMEEGVPIEHKMVTKRHRARAEAGRGAELLRPQAPPRIRRRDEQAAREHLLAASRAARRQDPHHGGGDGRHARVPAWRSPRSCSTARSSATPAEHATRKSRDLDALQDGHREIFGSNPPSSKRIELGIDCRPTQINDALWALALKKYESKEALIPAEILQRSSATSCCRSSTRSGRITSTASTT